MFDLPKGPTLHRSGDGARIAMLRGTSWVCYEQESGRDTHALAKTVSSEDSAKRWVEKG